MFQASESGDFEVRTGDGGCPRGRQIAAGHYGPGWEETTDPAFTASIPLGDTGLMDGDNAVVVCVRHGVATGEARTTVVVDDSSPAAPTLDIQPTQGAGVLRTSTTRALTFAGTAVGGRAMFELNGLPIRDLAVDNDGRWSLDWPLSLATDQAVFDVVLVDAAGNASRSNMIHIQILGDPPPVTLDDRPGLSVECRGAPALTAAACRAWAAASLAAHPEFLPRATRFILALPDQYGACYGESRGADGFTDLGLVVSCPAP